ncbi:MAG: transporter, family, multidrug resistance protein, partial [Candidatus Binataceae bacterium]|nr:transporter, family, multidrug resistance protein [Candidatus Binataceae bacterium]
DPILDLSIMKIPLFNIAVLAIMAMVLILYGTNLLNPLFLQNLMGYNAWRAGLAVAPRGAGTLVSMLLVGQLSRRGFDMRSLVGVGFALVAYATWMMGHWNLSVGTWALAIPIILSGVGSGFIFPTLSATTLSCVPKERMGYAASLYNMMRNTGSAIGISIVTNMLNSREQIHQAYLVQHFSVFDAWRMTARGARCAGLRLRARDGDRAEARSGDGLSDGAGAGVAARLQRYLSRARDPRSALYSDFSIFEEAHERCRCRGALRRGSVARSIAPGKAYRVTVAPHYSRLLTMADFR